METKPRILYLQKILLERTDEENPLSTTQLINILNDEYGISAHRTTVTKDIAALQEFGMDIVTIHSTQSKYFVASRKLELPELKLLIDAVESSKFITKKKSETLIEKIHTMTSPGQVAKLKRNNYVVNRIKPDNLAMNVQFDKEKHMENAKAQEQTEPERAGMTGKDNPFHYYPDFLTSSILELRRYENERHYKHDHQAPRRPRRERQGLHQGSQLHFVERKYRQAGHSRVASEPRTMRQGHHAYGGRGQKSLRSTQGNL